MNALKLLGVSGLTFTNGSGTSEEIELSGNGFFLQEGVGGWIPQDNDAASEVLGIPSQAWHSLNIGTGGIASNSPVTATSFVQCNLSPTPTCVVITTP